MQDQRSATKRRCKTEGKGKVNVLSRFFEMERIPFSSDICSSETVVSIPVLFRSIEEATWRFSSDYLGEKGRDVVFDASIKCEWDHE